MSPVFIRYDTQAQTGVDLSLDPIATEKARLGSGPIFAPRCWDETGRRVVFVGPGGYFFADLSQPSGVLHWTSEERVRPEDAPLVRSALGATPDAGARLVVSGSRRAVRLQSPTGETLAVHHAQGLLTTAIDVSDIALSPNRRIVAYIVTEHVGSLVAPSHAFALRLDSPPSALGPVELGATAFGPLQWALESEELYGCIQTVGGPPALVRWRLS